jgi:hypothetical protein
MRCAASDSRGEGRKRLFTGQQRIWCLLKQDGSSSFVRIAVLGNRLPGRLSRKFPGRSAQGGPDQCPRTGRPSRPSLNSQVFVLVDMPRCRSTATGRSLHRTHLAGPRPNLITPHSHPRNCHSLCFYVWRIVFLFSRVMSSPVHTGLERLPWPNPRPSPRKLCGFRGAHKGLPHSSNMQPSFLQHKRAMGLHSESAPQGC